jgi:hypothetical protein
MEGNYQQEYYQKNKKRLSKKHKERYDKIKKKRLKQIHSYQTKRKRVDQNYKLSKNLRRSLNQAINYYEKRGVVLKSKKYPIDFVKIINKLMPFPDRKQFQIDHIKPLCSFDLTDPEQIKIAFAPENLQWITPKQNLEKGKRT